MYYPFRHLPLKMLALALATLLWFSVSRDQDVERSLRVPLEYQYIPDELEIVGDPPGTVDVRVRGSSSTLGRLQAGDVVAVLDLRAARPGSRLFHLVPDQVRVPFGVTVSQVSPPTVSLTFERTGTKVVPVVPAIEGEPAPGYVAGEVRCEPGTVEVRGPESRLRHLAAATTEPVSIDNATATVRDVVTVGVIDAALRLGEAKAVTVTVQIVPAPIERTVRNVPVAVRNQPSPAVVRIVPPAVDVVVRGERPRVSALEGSDVAVFVDVANLPPGRYSLPVRATPGDGFGVVRTEPPVVEVRIR